MQVLIDQQPVDFAIEPSQPLGELLDRIRTHVAERRRVVARVAADGQAIPPDQLDEWLTRPTDQAGRLEVETACPRQLARQTLQAVSSLMGDVSQLHRGAAEKLAAGQTGKAMELLLGCLNLHKMAQEAVSHVVQLTRLDLNAMAIGGQSVGELFAHLAGRFIAVRTALESRDFVLLGDLLNYEFPRATEQWQALLNELDATLARAN